MTILFCERARGGGGTSETVEGDGPIRNVYRIPYLVKTSTTADDFQTIAAWFETHVYSAGLAYAQGNGFDLTSFAHRLTGERRPEKPKWWDLELEFQPRNKDSKDEKKDGSKTDDPLEARDLVEIDEVVESAPVERATYRSGFTSVDVGAGSYIEAGQEFAIVNSAGDPINDPAPEKEVGFTRIRIVKRFATWNDGLWKQYRRKVNKTAIGLYKPDYGIDLDFEPFTLKITSIKSSGCAIENRKLYWPVEFILDWLDELDEDGKAVRTWRHRELDRGRKRLASAGEADGRGGTYSNADLPAGIPELKLVEDLDGFGFDETVLFNGKGQPKHPSAPAVAIEWSKYEEVAMSAFFSYLNDSTSES